MCKKAYDIQNANNTVAVKIIDKKKLHLHPERQNFQQELNNIKREISNLKICQSDQIVKMLDIV